jgi:hypothetical protein
VPSTSKKQHNLMALVANDPAAANRLGIPQKVGKDFMEADKGRKFAKGGEMKHEDVKMDKAMMQKAVNKHESRLHKGAAKTKLANGGYVRAADGIAKKGKTKGTMVKMAYGGKAC